MLAGHPLAGTDQETCMSRELQGKRSKSSGGMMETLVVVVQALAIAMVVRVFFYQPFNIPSGSMKETLLVGDYLDRKAHV